MRCTSAKLTRNLRSRNAEGPLFCCLGVAFSPRRSDETMLTSRRTGCHFGGRTSNTRLGRWWLIAQCPGLSGFRWTFSACDAVQLPGSAAVGGMLWGLLVAVGEGVRRRTEPRRRGEGDWRWISRPVPLLTLAWSLVAVLMLCELMMLGGL